MNARTLGWYWLPVIAWMGMIFVASTNLMSGEHTSRFLVPLLRWLSEDISPEMIAAVQLLVRKAAHIAEYAILAMLLFRALVGGGKRTSIQPGIVVLIVSSYAALDEFHQSFVASRTGSPRDVAIDICGALLGVAIYWWFAGQKPRPQSSKTAAA